MCVCVCVCVCVCKTEEKRSKRVGRGWESAGSEEKRKYAFLCACARV